MELVTKHLDELENENLRNLIASMISRNPSDRKSAEVYLDEQRGKWAIQFLNLLKIRRTSFENDLKNKYVRLVL